MAPSIVHLPNGQNLSVSPVFGGLYFRANDLYKHHSDFPPGWTIILNSEDEEEDHHPPVADADNTGESNTLQRSERQRHVHRFKKPSLRNDHLFISSISNPSSNEFKPASSPTRQIAMMLWATLWWYFHQPAPSPYLTTQHSSRTPEEGRPKGEWRVNINREGIFKGKHLLPKLERMGLITTEDSSVGADPDDRSEEGWTRMFVSRRTFWQLDARIYLFTLTPMLNSPFPANSPNPSRPSSPSRNPAALGSKPDEPPGTPSLGATSAPPQLWRSGTPPGPFTSGSHLPTYYPPPPTQYTYTNNIRHPIRPKPPRQGETFYTRYVPSLGQYLSFRVACLSHRPVAHHGPVSTGAAPDSLSPQTRDSLMRGNGGGGGSTSISDSAIPTISSLTLDSSTDTQLTDVELLHKWMNDPRVAYSWGEDGPLPHQENFLRHGLSSKHSFPVIGSFDGQPFGFFELYWVREDRLSAHINPNNNVGDWDRGLHVLVGEQEYRGPHRVKVWLSALVHYCWLADLRTENVVMEPRVDNEKLRRYCEEVGFFKEKEVTFAHKQSNLMRIRREAWEAPAL